MQGMLRADCKPVLPFTTNARKGRAKPLVVKATALGKSKESPSLTRRLAAGIAAGVLTWSGEFVLTLSQGLKPKEALKFRKMKV